MSSQVDVGAGGVRSVRGGEPDRGGGAPEAEVPSAHLRVHPAAVPRQQDQQPGLQPAAPLLGHRLYGEGQSANLLQKIRGRHFNIFAHT